ncbi:MAG: hypothetical protein LBG70_02670, partial [Bifidobacteriaceae bacterium]|jgi:16S rRNA (cytosine967-C5)-methyltransferase|nr:hypothetical protein [Bifidobacteriaceae bacterium]
VPEESTEQPARQPETAALPEQAAGELWLDLCAGPGGKAALLGALAAGRGATLVANEPQAHRAELVRQTCRALPEGVVEVYEVDGRDVDEFDSATFDRVLVDVPCTGLGALRRRPESRWRHTPTDLSSLTPLQLELLEAGLAAARPGGLVAYSTCSPHIAETRLLVSDFMAAHADELELVKLENLGLPDDAIQPDGTCQLWTDLHHTDSLFLAIFRRLTPSSDTPVTD